MDTFPWHILVSGKSRKFLDVVYTTNGCFGEVGFWVHFHSCCHGGDRKKNTAFLKLFVIINMNMPSGALSAMKVRSSLLRREKLHTPESCVKESLNC